MQLKAAEISCKNIIPYRKRPGKSSFAFQFKKKMKNKEVVSIFTVNIYFITTQTTQMSNIAF